MTDNNHPITPPPELVTQWRNMPEYVSQLRTMDMVTITTEKLQDIATQAARWGADMELEACIEWLGDAPVVYNDNGDLHPGSYLRDARRSKPPNKKQRGLTALEATNLKKDDPLLYQEILNAIEGLPDD